MRDLNLRTYPPFNKIHPVKGFARLRAVKGSTTLVLFRERDSTGGRILVTDDGFGDGVIITYRDVDSSGRGPYICTLVIFS